MRLRTSQSFRSEAVKGKRLPGPGERVACQSQSRGSLGKGRVTRKGRVTGMGRVRGEGRVTGWGGKGTGGGKGWVGEGDRKGKGDGWGTGERRGTGDRRRMTGKKRATVSSPVTCDGTGTGGVRRMTSLADRLLQRREADACLMRQL